MSELGWKRRVRRRLSRTLRPVEGWLRKRLLLCTDRLAMSTPATPDADRVLLVRLDNIGDFVLWLDAARAVAEHYRSQGKHVTLLANAVWSGWAAEFEFFDEVIAIDERRFRQDLRYRLETGRRVRALRAGVAIQPAATRVLTLGDSLVRLSGATIRTGPHGSFDSNAQGDRAVGDRWYTALLPVDVDMHNEMRRNAAFVRALTGEAYKARVADLRRHVEVELDAALFEELHGRPYFVLFPGATFAGRLWPIERYVELADRLHAETGWIGVVSGGPSEAAQAATLCAEARSPVLNWVGRTRLSQLAGVLAHAEMLLANETSAVHIAAAVGVPSVCLLGGGHFGRFVPYDVEELDGRPLPVSAVQHMACFHCDWKCIYHPPKGSPVPCIEEISTAAAWAAVERVLATQRVSAFPMLAAGSLTGMATGRGLVL